MHLCLSSLAFNSETEKKVLDTVKKNGIQTIETVFTKIKPWDNLFDTDILAYKSKLDYYGLQTNSAQSLFYGLNYTLNDTYKVLSHFSRVINYSKILGINVLVFGSPMMRKHIDHHNLISLFSAIDTMLNGTGIKVVIEPNARIYGGEFWFSVSEISKFIEENNFNNIKTMVDYHNSILENNDPNDDLISYKNQIHHIHISELKLKPIQNYNEHKKFSNTIKQQNYSGIITYEILECAEILSAIHEYCMLYK